MATKKKKHDEISWFNLLPFDIFFFFLILFCTFAFLFIYCILVGFFFNSLQIKINIQLVSHQFPQIKNPIIDDN